MTANQLLEEFKIKKTPVRIAILELMMLHEFSLSQPEIENLLEDKKNRVTVYRVLRDFEQLGVIHKVYDHFGVAKFAVSKHTGEGFSEHVHFNCDICYHTFCLNEIAMPQIEIPIGFETNQVKLTVQGTCKNCVV